MGVIVEGGINVREIEAVRRPRGPVLPSAPISGSGAAADAIAPSRAAPGLRRSRAVVEARWPGASPRAPISPPEQLADTVAYLGAPRPTERAGRLDRLCAVAIVGAAAGAALVLAIAVAPHLLRGDNIAAAPARVVAEGAAVYATACAGCHGTDLKGQHAGNQAFADLSAGPPPLDGSGHAWLHSDTELQRIVEGGLDCPDIAGGTTMPGFAGRLSPEALQAALTFVKSRWPRELREIQHVLSDSKGQIKPRPDAAALCSPLCRPAASTATAQVSRPAAH